MSTCKLTTRFLAGLIILWGATAFAANGSLKVTSYPTGAEVFVDGGTTGKFTPMSVSLVEGDHEIVVQVPGGTWEPDIRTVTISPGNNDLSITLIPTATEGPPGPIGPAGPAGPIGPSGTDGANGADGAPGIGLPGLQGVQGPPGSQGQTGASGPQGSTGPKGDPGPMGSAGVGVAGPPGLQGPPGTMGSQGVQGPQGIQGPPGTSGSGEASRQLVWVGNTTAEGFSGADGIVSRNIHCHASFPGSRMCTSVEVAETPNPPNVTFRAWVRPVFAPHVMLPNTENIDRSVMDEILGVVVPTGSLNCSGWGHGGSTQTGLIVSPGYLGSTISTFACDAFFAVACCAPTP